MDLMYTILLILKKMYQNQINKIQLFVVTIISDTDDATK